jgi:ABC-type phosphate transport system substrate-binding protein
MRRTRCSDGLVRRIALLASLVLAGWLPWHARAADLAFVVIAAPGAPEHRLTREALARIFLRKQVLWENGTRIQPVNLPANHALRRAFSHAVLGSVPEGLEDYWRDMYFHGVLPPHVLASEEAVVLFVASTPGAIGYVSPCVPGLRSTVVVVGGDTTECPK